MAKSLQESGALFCVLGKDSVVLCGFRNPEASRVDFNCESVTGVTHSMNLTRSLRGSCLCDSVDSDAIRLSVYLHCKHLLLQLLRTAQSFVFL